MKHLKVDGLMTDDVVSALPQTSFRDAAKLLAEHDIGGVPVVDADDHVVGVVCASGLLARRALTARAG
ncbi:CBS domain-containing protein [Streptomyces hydrogenans]|uniref:CBS domain-containing protein n=1 Tax=Streptomyces hydrogenans TaxID=1873719 RepID=UPI0035D92E01